MTLITESEGLRKSKNLQTFFSNYVLCLTSLEYYTKSLVVFITIRLWYVREREWFAEKQNVSLLLEKKESLRRSLIQRQQTIQSLWQPGEKLAKWCSIFWLTEFARAVHCKGEKQRETMISKFPLSYLNCLNWVSSLLLVFDRQISEQLDRGIVAGKSKSISTLKIHQ